MAITTERIVGHEQTVTIGEELTDWDTISVTITDSTENAGGSDSTQNEVVVTDEMISIDASGFLGSANNNGTLPQKGDLLEDISSKVGTDNVLPDLARFNNVRITEVKYDLKKGPATFSWKARSGVLNRINGVDAGGG